MSLSAKAQEILDELEASIASAFGNTSVPAEETLEIMQSALGSIETNISALREDIGEHAMKVWVPKQREVKVEVILEANEDLDLKKGDLQVTDADGRTKIHSPAEFDERFEEIEKNSWPGYLKRKMGNGSYSPGTAVVGFDGANMTELVAAVNAWAEKAENRLLILGDHGDHYWTGADGRCYAIMYVYAETSPESQAHLDEVAELEAEVKRQHAEKKKQAGIDERNLLEKAKELRAAQEAIDRQRQRELLDKERVADQCKNNHGKLKRVK